MWACPGTTCGRPGGFGFDIHLAEPLWQCAQCQHWYYPKEGDFRAFNARCPEWRATLWPTGLFDDECDDEDLAEEQLAREELSTNDGIIPEGIELPDQPPWADQQGEEWKRGGEAGGLLLFDYVAETPAKAPSPTTLTFHAIFRRGTWTADGLGPEDIPF